MRRIPMLPGIRALIPRASLISRPLLPLTTRLPVQRLTAPAQSSWRMFYYSPLRSRPPSSPRSPSSTSEGNSKSNSDQDVTLTQRLKHLIKTYGWYALGVYFIVSTLDLAAAFAAVNVIGLEKVQHVTDVVKDRVSSILHSTPPEPGKQEYETAPSRGGREGLYAMIILAYTVHKLFLPIRVGLTAAFTPRLVNWLTRRGWAGGEGTKRAAREMRDRMRRDRD